MTRKPETIAFWRGRLPHWEVTEGRYFVTMHLAGAIPQAGHDRIHEIATMSNRLIKNDHESWLLIQRHVFREMEDWLDRAVDVRHLGDARIAKMVLEAVARRAKQIWTMFEYVIMPNHVHLFFEMREGSLKTTLEGFKRWTGHEAGKLIDLKGKSFWQHEWFDHWSRSDEEDERIIEYIRRNPEKAGLVTNYRDWPYGSWAA